MLVLKRITCANDFLMCKVSGEVICPGDFYYKDDDDGLIVRADVYHEYIKKKKESEFDYTKLNNAKSQQEYEEQLKKLEQQFLKDSLLDRKVILNGRITKHENTMDFDFTGGEE